MQALRFCAINTPKTTFIICSIRSIEKEKKSWILCADLLLKTPQMLQHLVWARPEQEPGTQSSSATRVAAIKPTGAILPA